MPIGTIIEQPTADGIKAAYRPVVIRVAATKTGGDPIPPVVYCDIYFNDIFYKTLCKSQYTLLNTGVDSEWEFDIQDAAQEYLRKFLGAVGESTIVEADTVVVKAQCKLRSSGIDVDGFIAHEDTAPIQGTSSSDPVAGTGTASNTFYIVNAALQHEDNQLLDLHLASFKKRTWSNEAFPLTHRPDNYKMGPDASDVFPILYSGAAPFQKLRLRYRLCDQTSFGSIEANVAEAPVCSARISIPTAVYGIGGWMVSWHLVFGTPGKYFVSTAALSGGAPYETISTSILLGELPIGDHVVTVRGLCFIDGNWYFGELQTMTITVVACVPVDITAPVEFPRTFATVAFSYYMPLTGTAPFTLSDIVKPAWMTIEISGANVWHHGTPPEADGGVLQNVSWKVTNCGGADDDYAGTTTPEPLPEPNFFVANEAPGTSINMVQPNVYTVRTGAFPLFNGEELEGHHSGFSDNLIVNISIPAGTYNIELYRDGALIQSLPVTTSGYKILGGHVFTPTEEPLIKLVEG